MNARTRQPVAPVPRIALTKQEAADALGMSVTSFEGIVQPEVRAIRRMRTPLFWVAELERWADENSERVLG